jgi:hypothetical protein
VKYVTVKKKCKNIYMKSLLLAVKLNAIRHAYVGEQQFNVCKELALAGLTVSSI